MADDQTLPNSIVIAHLLFMTMQYQCGASAKGQGEVPDAGWKMGISSFPSAV